MAPIPTISAVQDDDDLGIYVWTAIIVFLAALGVSGGTHLYMMLIDHPLIRQHKATLEFRSAVIGDGVILPIASVLMVRGLRHWGTRPGRRSVLASLTLGVLCTSIVHLVQARRKLVNWTMPTPWQWTWLGKYHMVYMAAQFAFTFFYGQEVLRAWQRGRLRDSHKRDLGLILAGVALLGILLQTDYQE